MSKTELIFCCQSCSKLFIGSRPDMCPCGSKNIRQGLEALSFEAKKELAAIRRKEDNSHVTAVYSLKGAPK